MQTVRFNSRWQWHEPGDVATLPMRESVHLIDRGICTEVRGQTIRFASAKLSRRSLNLAPKSLDKSSRTVEALIATELPVPMSTLQRGDFNEVLLCKPENVDLHRLNSSAPVLDSHDLSGLDEVLGVVVPGSAKAIGRGIIAKLKFNESPDGERAFGMVASGLNSISIGYLTHDRRIDDSVRPPLHRITEWTPYEVSLVTVPADTAASFL